MSRVSAEVLELIKELREERAKEVEKKLNYFLGGKE